MSREDALRATIKTLDEKIEWQNKKIASEHELYLTAHRDNMKGATLLMEARSKLAASETNLEAASDEFKRLEYMAQEVAKERGEALAQVQALTRERDAYRQAAEGKPYLGLLLRAEQAEAKNAEQAKEIERLKEQSDEWASHAGESDGRIAALEARERELVKELERSKNWVEMQAAQEQIASIQSEKSLLTKAVEDAKSKCDLYGFVIDELEKNLSDFLTKLGKKTMPVGWARRTIDAALTPAPQIAGEAKAYGCGKRFVFTDGFCGVEYLCRDCVFGPPSPAPSAAEWKPCRHDVEGECGSCGSYVMADDEPAASGEDRA